ncbi:MAG: type II toxin-antitoxin system VapC family toxin [Bacteroidota bacterium]
MVFLDTGFLIALADASDQHHRAAVAYWTEARPLPKILTTSFVLDEVATFLNSRGFHAKAIDVVDRLQASPRVQIVHPDEDLFGAAWEYFRSRPDKRYSLTDCLSFIVMSAEGLQDALAFDAHFEQAGFVRHPV